MSFLHTVPLKRKYNLDDHFRQNETFSRIQNTVIILMTFFYENTNVTFFYDFLTVCTLNIMLAIKKHIEDVKRERDTHTHETFFQSTKHCDF